MQLRINADEATATLTLRCNQYNIYMYRVRLDISKSSTSISVQMKKHTTSYTTKLDEVEPCSLVVVQQQGCTAI